MKKKRIKKILVFFLCLAIMIWSLDSFLSVNSPNIQVRVQGLYREPKNSLDVVLIGASEVHTGFMPTEAYKKYGFTSYLVSIDSLTGNLYKSLLTESLKNQNPKLVVFEINGFLYNEKDSNNQASYRRWLDNIPWSQNKIDTMNTLVPSNLRYSYIFPLFQYHLAWMNINYCFDGVRSKVILNRRGFSYLKGFDTYSGIDTSTKLSQNDKYFIDQSKQNLIDLLNFCKEKKLKNVLFTRFPHKEILNYSSIEDEIRRYVESYGYSFANFNNCYNESGMDVSYDFYNEQHMNIFGAEKFTDYLSSYITKNYDLNVTNSDNIKKEWNTSVQYAEKFKRFCEGESIKKTNKFYYETSRIKK